MSIKTLPIEERRAYSRAVAKRHYWRHRKRIRENIRLLRKSNPEKINGPQYRWRKKNPEKYAAIKKRTYLKNKDKILSKHRVYRQNLRVEVLAHYGNKCSCCKESRNEFLAIDHINNDGKAHRLIAGRGAAFHIWIKKNNFPKDLQVLCHNCNLSKAFYGYCPHHRSSYI